MILFELTIIMQFDLFYGFETCHHMHSVIPIDTLHRNKQQITNAPVEMF